MKIIIISCLVLLDKLKDVIVIVDFDTSELLINNCGDDIARNECRD